jgi:hypothetical protein
LRHGPREEVHLQEVVAPDLSAPVLKACLKRATNARAHMPIDKDAPLAEFERLAPRFPVFRIVPRYESQNTNSSELIFRALLSDHGARDVRFERSHCA